MGSTPAWKMLPSDADFIFFARGIEIETKKACKSFSKSNTFYIGVPLSDSATRIHRFLKLGNGIYPRNQHEVQMRRDWMIRAKGELEFFISELEVAKELTPKKTEQNSKGLDFGILEVISGLCKKELGLIKGIIESDIKRYVNLP